MPDATVASFTDGIIVITFSIYLFIWKIYIRCPLCTKYCAEQCEQCNGDCNKAPASTQPSPESRQAQNYSEQKTKEEERQERADNQTFNEMNSYFVFF